MIVSLSRVVTAASLVLASVSPVAQTPGWFDASGRVYPCGSQGRATHRPSDHAVADVDGDGDLDVIHSTWDGFFPVGVPRAALLRNRGDGTYEAPVWLSTGGNTASVTAADVNGDGAVDLAFGVSNTLGSGNRVLVLLGNGDGTFANGGRHACGSGPLDLAAGDMDGDGDVDLVSANLGADSVTVLLNDGSGQFGARRDAGAGGRPQSLRLGDLDGDGDLDVAVSGGSGAPVRVLFNEGGGQLTLRSTPPAAVSALAGIAMGDVDRDGDLDLVWGAGAAQGLVSSFTLWRNDGAGGFGAGERLATGLSFRGAAVDIADIDGDGWPDIAGCALGNFNDWCYLPGDGAGGFLSARMKGSAGEYSTALVIADVDRDGDGDVLIGNEGSNTLSVHEFDSGAFRDPPPTTVAQLTVDFDIADLDLDGDLDIVCADSTLHRLINRGDGTFENFSVALRLGRFRFVRLRDLDGDGYPDLLMVKSSASPPYDLYTAINDGTGRFGAVVQWQIRTCGGNDLETLDWDGDGDLDVIVSETLGCLSVPFQRLFYLENKGDGTFEPPVTEDNVLYPIRDRMAAADFDRDGNMDFATTASGPGLAVHLGRGDGTFVGPTAIAVTKAPGPSWLTTADMNRDGDMDLVFTSAMEGTFGFDCEVGVFLGNGDGTFVEMEPQYGPWSLQFLAEFSVNTMDADGDGVLDVIASGISSSEVLVFRGTGDGNLQPAQRYAMPGDAWRSRGADMDGDGRDDLVVLVHAFPPIGNGQIVVLFGGDGEICQPDLGFAGPGSTRLTVCGPALHPGNAAELLLRGAPASAPCALGFGFTATPTPILGGTLVPLPLAVVLPSSTDPGGALRLAPIASGAGPLDVFVQAVVLDAGQPRGLQFSNAVRVEFLP